jgi:recombination protein RecA
MAANKKRQLEMTITALQARWGRRAVRRLGDSAAEPAPTLATGLAALDQALGGGLPRGRITELIGVPSSGMATLALKIVAHSQRQAPAVYIDPDHIFDPDYAVRCGVDLDRLLLVRPADYRQALAIVADFVAGGRQQALVMGASFQPPPAGLADLLTASLNRLPAPLSHSGCVLLFLTTLPAHSPPDLAHYPAHLPLPGYTAVRLLLQRERWLYRRRDIIGYQAQLLVVKNKLGPAGRQVSLALTFDDHAPLDGESSNGESP